MSIGYGDAICPQCYNGEEHFIFFDNSYWLNRLLIKLIPNQVYTKRRPSARAIENYDEIYQEHIFLDEEYKIVH